ncbi:MAG TPA: pilus assembly protein [Burkholderiaceae bacterium]|nr:pilus assembly protein [Burkholderiaceae bacterium]
MTAHPLPASAARAPGRSRQRGATLFVALTMLALLALAAVTSHGLSRRNVMIAGNMQVRNEAIFAAQQVIEQTISSPAFTRDPHAAAASPYPVDVDGDGRPDYTVRLNPRPTCLRVRPVRTIELDPQLAGDVSCMGTSAQPSTRDFGAAGAGGGNSLCFETTWDVSAEVADRATGAQTVLHQGIAVRIAVSDAINSCL